MFLKNDLLVRLRVMVVAGFLVMGVWQSTSFAGWMQITVPGTTSIAYVAVADSVLFASANQDSMVFRSTDHGATWQKVTGLRSCDNLKGNNTKLYAIESYFGNGGILFSSSDKGISWSRVNTIDSVINFGVLDLSVQGNKILFIITSSNAMYRRPVFSEDNGQSWSILNSNTSAASMCCYSMGKNLFLGGSGGVFMSSNSGHTWYESNYGILGMNLITKLSGTGTYLYIGYSAPDKQTGIYCSIDSGYTWRSMGFKPYNFCRISDISFSKTTTFVGTDSGVYAAPLDSAHWTDISTPPKSYVESLAIDSAFLYASNGSLFRRPLSEVNALLKKQVAGSHPLISNNFIIDHFTSQHALGITFNLGRAEKASLRVYSATGKAIATLFDGTTQYGTNKFIWDYKTMPSGIYCISLQSENGKAVKKVQVMR
jgi:photosystem II stability/assembly factor-like uncharacterized protein